MFLAKAELTATSKNTHIRLSTSFPFSNSPKPNSISPMSTVTPPTVTTEPNLTTTVQEQEQQEEEQPILIENQEPEQEQEEEEPEEESEPEEEELEEPINPNQTPVQDSPITTQSPLFLDSITNLKNLSSAMTNFHQCYDDLQSHLNSIKDAIFSMKTDTQMANSVPDAIIPSGSDQSELEGLCRTMCSRGIRKYISANLSDLSKLREEVPKALRLAANVPKFVLECLGKFYLQGTKAYVKNSHMNGPREASIFVLECFLLLMRLSVEEGVRFEVDETVRVEAELAAVGWKKRLVVEGGLDKCNVVDARGLLMLVACFGVPSSFKREDVRDLVVVGRVEEIAGLLKNSKVLMDKITEIVEGMMKNKMKVDAVDLAYTFGLEERFDPQIILLAYLEESKEFLKKPKRGGSADALNDAKKKQLDALKSVRKCLQRHKVDPIKLLPGWQIEEMISTLHKEIADHSRKSDAKVPQKRKPNETESSSRKPKPKEAKRSRYTNQGPPHQHATNHFDTRRHMLPNYPVSYPPSVIYGGPGAGLHPDNMISQGVGVGSYAGGSHGSVLVDASGQVLSRPQHYVYDAALVEKYAPQPLVGLTSLYRGSTSSAGLQTSPSLGAGSRSSGSDLYQFADSVAEREAFVTGVKRVGGVPTSLPEREAYVTGVQRVGGVPTSLPGHHSSYLYHHQL